MKTQLTVSFPLAALNATLERKEIYQVLHKEISENVDDDQIAGIQLFPSGWPRKVLLTVTDKDVKEDIVIKGLNLFGNHIDVRDEGNVLMKVIVRDAPLELNDEVIEAALRDYGDVIRIEKEMIYVDGNRTNCSTGTRFVFMSQINVKIPPKLSITLDEDKSLTVSVWSKGQQITTINHCGKCGYDTHSTQECFYDKPVCFRCQDPTHRQRYCPLNDGTKQNDSVLCFLSGKAVLSNFNTKYPITIGGVTYTCNEQYIQKQKCALFGDEEAEKKVMEATEPRDMKYYGDHVKKYVHKVWMKECQDVAMTCNREKFSAHEEAKEALLKTGRKILGEATTSRKWGIGKHISDPLVLDQTQWDGENLMGNVLMQIRSDLQSAQISEITDDIDRLLEERQDSKESNQSEDSNKISEMGDVNEEKDLDGISTETTGEEDNGQKNIEKNQLALVFGDSNTHNLPLDDSDLPVKVNIISESGLQFSQVEMKMKEYKDNPEQVTVVLLHVGTCTWKPGVKPMNTAKQIYTEYVEMLNVASTKFPKAELVLSGVLPRVPRKESRENTILINKEAEDLNIMLKELSTKEDNIIFVDNNGAFTSEGNVYKQAYQASDSKGVHINMKGKSMLADNFKAAIREAHGKNALRIEWDIVGQSS